MKSGQDDISIRELHPRNGAELAVEMAGVGVDPRGIEIMVPKAGAGLWKIMGLSSPALNILKQEFLSSGGDLAVHRGVVEGAPSTSSGIIIANTVQLRIVSRKLTKSYYGLDRVGGLLRKILDDYDSGRANDGFNFKARDSVIPLGGGRPPAVMGILNLTPDSFYDGGSVLSVGDAAAKGESMIAAGAAVIDIGGESTRPGAAPVSTDEELDRVIPVVEALAGRVNAPISIDTTKAAVAGAALDAGASIINDVSAGLDDPDMPALAAAWSAGIILMHRKGSPAEMQIDPRYEDLLDEVCGFLLERSRAAVEAGIPEESIMIDPGIGFGKTLEHNLTLLGRIREVMSLGYPVLAGLSRKSFIGALLDDAPPERRLAGSIAASAVCSAMGVHMLRAHDVQETVEACRVAAAIAESGE